MKHRLLLLLLLLIFPAQEALARSGAPRHGAAKDSVGRVKAASSASRSSKASRAKGSRKGGKSTARNHTRRWAPPRDPTRTIQPLTLTMYNVNTQERLTDLPAFYTKASKPDRLLLEESARGRLERFVRDPHTERVKHPMPENLWFYLYLVSYHFDRPIYVVSGYRSRERRTSRHRQGKAIDFYLPDVPTDEVWRFAKERLVNSGVGLGYYPNSGFIHLDIRDRSYFWIDDSGPGQRARYRQGVRQPDSQWKMVNRRQRRSSTRR